ncbi:MAG: hypothetical protein ACXAEU_01455 [Candidatus Hodarchaeales archaeon]
MSNILEFNKLASGKSNAGEIEENLRIIVGEKLLSYKIKANVSVLENDELGILCDRLSTGDFDEHPVLCDYFQESRVLHEVFLTHHLFDPVTNRSSIFLSDKHRFNYLDDLYHIDNFNYGSYPYDMVAALRMEEKNDDISLLLGNAKMGYEFIVGKDGIEYGNKKPRTDDRIAKDLSQLLLGASNRNWAIDALGMHFKKYEGDIDNRSLLRYAEENKNVFEKRITKILSGIGEIAGSMYGIQNTFLVYVPIKDIRNSTRMILVFQFTIPSGILEVGDFFNNETSYEIAVQLNEMTRKYFGGAKHASYFFEVSREIVCLDDFVKDTLKV